MVATLAVGALVVAIALVATLSRSETRASGSSPLVVTSVLDSVHGSHRICQGGELIPAGTAAVRASVLSEARPPPSVRVELLREPGLTPLAGGAAARWDGTGLVPVQPPVRAETIGRVCLSVRGGPADVIGAPTEAAIGATDGGASLKGRLHVDYALAGSSSWWSFAPTVVDRIGRGHAWSGSSVALAAALLLLASISLAAWLLVREA